MRLPSRVVGDYHVDRQEMYALQGVQSTCTNSPRSFRPEFLFAGCYLSQDIYCGGYSGGEPPLPIPNREVKPAIADGTAPPGGRVGSCRSLTTRTSETGPGRFVGARSAGTNQRTSAAYRLRFIGEGTPQTPPRRSAPTKNHPPAPPGDCGCAALRRCLRCFDVFDISLPLRHGACRRPRSLRELQYLCDRRRCRWGGSGCHRERFGAFLLPVELFLRHRQQWFLLLGRIRQGCVEK